MEAVHHGTCVRGIRRQACRRPAGTSWPKPARSTCGSGALPLTHHSHHAWQRQLQQGLQPAVAAAAAAAAAAATAPVTAEDWNLLQPELQPVIGPVDVRILEGKGRGVVTTRQVQAGELLLCVPPVAILNTPTGRPRADGEQLVDHIIDHGLWRRAWFQALYDGTPKSCQTCLDVHTPADALGTNPSSSSSSAAAPADAAKPQGFSAAGGPKSGSARKSKVKRAAPAAAADPVKAALQAAGLDRKAAKRIALTTKLNCYGDNHEDLALCELRHEQPRGHIGIWGPFAMLNHSCAPNAINYVTGDFMVVRAARDISTGEEVTISYLGRPQLAPVGARRTKLQEDYGFECSCERCTLEVQHIDKLDESLYEELHLHACNKLRAGFERAVQEQDREELEALHEQTQASLSTLAQTFRKTMISPKARLYILASLYEAFELHLDLCAALDLLEEKAYHLGGVLKSIEAVTPGSDLHAILSAQHHALQVQLHGQDADAARAAYAAAVKAHAARYGPLSDALLQELMQLNIKLYR